MSSVMPISSASDIQMDYMKLLVTQLQNQNPLNPLENQDMAAQLAQFSSLQQLENMNTSFSSVLSSVQGTYANSLIGKEVSFLVQNSDGVSELTTGVVQGVIKQNNKQMLVVGNYTPTVDDVVSVKEVEQ